MKPAKREFPFKTWASGMGVGALLLLLHLVVARPLGAKYTHKLQSLHPEQVLTLRLHTEDRVGVEYLGRERVLTGQDRARFLTLLSEAKPCSSNHRSGGWACFVDIDTTIDIPRFSFIVRSTGTHGVQFDLNPSGFAHGETLRNDALGSFVEALFRRPETDTPNKNGM